MCPSGENSFAITQILKPRPQARMEKPTPDPNLSRFVSTPDGTIGVTNVEAIRSTKIEQYSR